MALDLWDWDWDWDLDGYIVSTILTSIELERESKGIQKNTENVKLLQIAGCDRPPNSDEKGLL